MRRSSVETHTGPFGGKWLTTWTPLNAQAFVHAAHWFADEEDGTAGSDKGEGQGKGAGEGKAKGKNKDSCKGKKGSHEGKGKKGSDEGKGKKCSNKGKGKDPDSGNKVLKRPSAR